MSQPKAAPGSDRLGAVPKVSEHESACRLTITIPADPRAISVVVERVARELEQRKWREDDVTAVQLALIEALANAIRHGCRGDITKRVRCSVGCSKSDEIVIIVRDPGDGFNPDGVPDPLDPVNTFKPSGRGMFLMRAFMDRVVFADGGREVQMRKRKARERKRAPSVDSDVPEREKGRQK
jgi:serine/threonine-protein kinase RsbW